MKHDRRCGAMNSTTPPLPSAELSWQRRFKRLSLKPQAGRSPQGDSQKYGHGAYRLSWRSLSGGPATLALDPEFTKRQN